MDINARINWKAGIELDARTMSKFDEVMSMHRKAIAVSNSTLLGVLPGYSLNVSASFVKRSLQFDIRNLLALLPSGSMIEVDEESVINFTTLDEGEHYVCVGLGRPIEYESDGVPLTRPSNVYSILRLSELEQADVMPILKLEVKDEVAEIIQDYVAPVLKLSSDRRLIEWKDILFKKLQTIICHPHLVDLSFKRALSLAVSSLSVFESGWTMEHFVDILGFSAQFISTYMENEEDHIELPAFHFADVLPWLKESSRLLDSAIAKLDKTIPVDDSIDVDALKSEIKTKLTDELKAELSSEMDIKLEMLSAKMINEMTARLRNFINGEMRQILHDDLHAELEDKLAERLYPSLYEALYSALYVPQEEEKVYVPII